MVWHRRWLVGGVTVAAAAALVGAPAASAAGPQQIFKDYADNGRLDQRYSRSDLERALKNASIQGYQPTVSVHFRPKIQQALGTAGAQTSRPVTVRRTRTLPFTGLDLALLAAGGAGLLGIGAGLRRLARNKA